MGLLIQAIIRLLHFMWYQLDPDEIPLDQIQAILLDPDAKKDFPNQYNALLDTINLKVKEIRTLSEEQNRIAYVQPSYEQALKLNIWWFGTDYIVDFDANRIGKTAGAVLNTALWIYPNEPEWKMFTPHTDHLNRTFQILPRPPISALSHIRALVKQKSLHIAPYLPHSDPENLPSYNIIKDFLSTNRKLFLKNQKHRIIWVGAPDHDFHEDVLIPEFVKWFPHHGLKVHNYDGKISISLPHQHKVTIIFKSYDSEDTKWSGAAVDGIVLSEGVPQSVFNEVRQRYKYPAFASWDYTPYEPRNTTGKSALAHRVFKDPTLLPLNPIVFSGYGITNTPTYILPQDKKDDLIKTWKDDPEGEARLHGLFYSSSPIILKNYQPKIHAIPISFDDLRRKFSPKPLLLFRGIDPGWSHVTACAWMALAPDNCRYIYRFYSKPQASIEERCQDIIELSNNKRVRHPKSPQLWQEHSPNPENQIKITFIDYHTFKTDENTKRPFAYNYINNGLAVRPSITYGPKERATLFNSLLLPQAHLPHPMTSRPPGSKIYFLINEPGVAQALDKMSNLFWQTFARGEKAGLTKDAPQDVGDDEFDATTYVVLPILNYHSFSSVGFRENFDGQEPQRLLYSQVK